MHTHTHKDTHIIKHVIFQESLKSKFQKKKDHGREKENREERRGS